MKNYTRWALSNSIVLAAFVGGIVYTLPSLTILAVIIYWLTALGATILYVGVVSPLAKHVKKETVTKTISNQSHIPKWLDATVDIGVVAVFMYFSYPVLAIAYLWHIYALLQTRTVLEGYAHEISCDTVTNTSNIKG